ncbi:cilia- and flagella-associated protein 97 isoform X2 [Tachysurus fulvidraco]|uniref:cilia- and flagella-associated protein 97 isoform X2 n=1 Tax=Tachysurus fulvidraco TaxID=1234273 RepID=UPI000F4DA89C|nr:cilia- and flagella-associated protein 97 isoform X2 [Tachysurus fulvidraco]
MMYSPKELEGEVDHSFFDSDCDVTGTKPEKPVHLENEERDNTKEKLPIQNERRREKEKYGEETLAKEMSGLQVQSGLIAKDGSERVEEIRKKEELEKEDPFEQKDGVKKDKEARGTDDSDTSSRKSSPLPCSDMSKSNHGSKSDESSSICSSSSAAEEDDAVFKSEDVGSRRNRPPRKSTGKSRTRSHSYVSSSSSGERSPTPVAKPTSSQSTSSPRRQPRPGSANRKQRPKTTEMEDSDDTVTDVTPLSSPDVSPQQSFDLAPPTSSETLLPAPNTDNFETVDGQQNTDREERSAVLSAGRQIGSSSSISSTRSSASRHSKNYSFNNEEVRRIEHENQRLLRELSRSSTRTSSRSTRRSPAPACRLYHSALNRQREQQRIQQENLHSGVTQSN